MSEAWRINSTWILGPSASGFVGDHLNQLSPCCSPVFSLFEFIFIKEKVTWGGGLVVDELSLYQQTPSCTRLSSEMVSQREKGGGLTLAPISSSVRGCDSEDSHLSSCGQDPLHSCNYDSASLILLGLKRHITIQVEWFVAKKSPWGPLLPSLD